MRTVCNKYQQRKVGEDPLLCSLQELGEYKNEEKTYRSVKVDTAAMEHEDIVSDVDKGNSENVNNKLDCDNADIEDDGIDKSKYNGTNLPFPSLNSNSEQSGFIVIVRKILVFAPIGHGYLRPV